MKITIKVNASEKPEGKDYESIVNTFEIVFDGTPDRFLQIVAKVIEILPERPTDIKTSEVIP